VEHTNRDAANHPFSLRNSRWRTWLRVRTPDVLYYRLGLVIPKAVDCGAHDWHNNADGTDACYHCQAIRPTTTAVLDQGVMTSGEYSPRDC